MDKNNSQTQTTQQSGGQNPTLNAPGSKVADYGNPEGGSGNNTVEEQGNSTPQVDERISGRQEDTVGNP